MALPIVACFRHKGANDRKLGRMVLEKFPVPTKPDAFGNMGCYPWVGINPDSFNLLMQDSVFRDSVQAANRKGPDTKTPGGESDGTEAPSEEDKEKGKKNIFQRIFNHKPDEEEKKKKGN